MTKGVNKVRLIEERIDWLVEVSGSKEGVRELAKALPHEALARLLLGFSDVRERRMEAIRLDAKAKKMQSKKRDHLVSRIHEAGLTLEEVNSVAEVAGVGVIRGAKVPPKYRIEGAGEGGSDFEWSGRGKKPRQIVEYLENGGTLESILIDP